MIESPTFIEPSATAHGMSLEAFIFPTPYAVSDGAKKIEVLCHRTLNVSRHLARCVFIGLEHLR
jgi:hypothetical protein